MMASQSLAVFVVILTSFCRTCAQINGTDWYEPAAAATANVTDPEADSDLEHFKIGLLSPWQGSFGDFSALTSASAVSIATEYINTHPTLGKKMRFSVVTRDSGCSSKVAAANAVKLFVEEQIDVFIGPACSIACHPAAQLASFWNKPIISWVAMDPAFNDRSIYTTLARTLGTFTKMAEFLLEVFEFYGWKRTVLVASHFYIWEDAARALLETLTENNVTVAYSAWIGQEVTHNQMDSIIRQIKVEGRIVVVAMPKDQRREFMLKAFDSGLTSGDYVFYTIEMLPEENVGQNVVWSGTDGRNADALKAFEAVFHVTIAALTDRRVNDFRLEVARRMRKPPWSDLIDESIDMSTYTYGDKYSPFLHDAVLLYAIALNESMRRGEDVRSGETVAKNMRGKSFEGVTGWVVLDMNGDREPDYWIFDMAANGTFVKIAEVVNRGKGARVFNNFVGEPRWPGGKVGHEFAPPDTPPCGFINEFCSEENVAGWIITLAVLVGLMALAAGAGLGVYLYKRGRYEAELLLQTWKVEWEDIETIRTVGGVLDGSTPTLLSNNQSVHSKASSISNAIPAQIAGIPPDISDQSQCRSMPSQTTLANSGGQIFSDIGLYKGTVVALKRIKKDHIQVNRAVLIEFNEMKDIIHENVNVFVGACIDPPNICILWQYCSKGSLLDVLENDDYKLDSTFKLSFMVDISSGMQYLHSTVIGSHGNLKDSNCLVDCRWSVKITDYGLSSILDGQEMLQNENEQYKAKLWTAPELLRENFPPPKGTQKGDVYSFAIVAYEIIMRSEPYTFETMTPRDVVNRVRNGESVPFRPTLPESTELGKPMLDMIKKCWAEDPGDRPMFSQIRSMLKKMAKGNINIMDKVLKMMEKYAYNLESIVEERTQQLMEEKKKTDKLLYRMLPSTVAEQLKAGMFVQPENYDQATVYFSDVVGFTQMASESTPMQIVDFLNDLYSCFDAVIAEHDVYKVETIGDAYMVVSGLPVRNGARHVTEIANVSLDLLSEVTHFKIRHRPHQQLLLRIGLHSGPVVAGVVGLIMPRYCLFGDTVNMAARMESNGKPLCIHISKATYILLSENSNDYEMTLRGEMNVKGKGLQMTYWLHGRKGFSKPLPVFNKDDLTKEENPAAARENHGRSPMMHVADSIPSDSEMPPVE